MSLESYKKSMDALRERVRESAQPQPKSQPHEQEATSEKEHADLSDPRKHGFRWLIFSFIVIAIIVVAAVKNPSATETKALIKDALVETFNEKIEAKMMSDEDNGAKQLGAFLGMALAPHVLDYFTTIDVNDYVVFSTFDCRTKDEEESRTIVSGVVVFGKVIPLKSDLNTEGPELG